MKTINYAKENFHYQRSIERYKDYVAKHGLLCQECGGAGQVLDDAIDFGDDWCGPIMQYIYATCGWCHGTGKVTRWLRGQWLRFKKESKRERLYYQSRAFAEDCKRRLERTESRANSCQEQV